MEWLNYHHLRYFWTVAREGSIARACEKLLLSQPTISGQIRELEKTLGARLFDRVGRNLQLTETGRRVYHYANQIFLLGQDLQDSMQGRAAAGALRLVVGVADVLPRLVVYQLLKPAMDLAEPVQLVCIDDKVDALLSRLAIHELDVVLADVPVSPLVRVRAYNHLLGSCGVCLLASARLVSTYRRGFPASLDGAPFLFPVEGSSLRRSLDEWFESVGVRPRNCAEFGDYDLFETFAESGAGIFAIPSVVEAEARRHHRLRLLARVDVIRETFYAISTERKPRHPAVVAIAEQARDRLAE